MSYKEMSYKEFAVNDSLDNRDAYAFNVERILGHFLWEAGPMNVTMRRQNNNLVT